MVESFEVEIKVPITDPEMIRQKLLTSGARVLNSEVQIDTYFDHPCRTFMETDEAVRVRTRRPLDDMELDDSHSMNELTYKGPKIDKKTKTRLEYSVAIDNTDNMLAILGNLSFRSAAVITKKRTFYNLRNITISIDDVENVGLFLEFESIAHGRDEVEFAKATIFGLLDELGIDPKQSVRESYLEIFMGQKKD